MDKVLLNRCRSWMLRAENLAVVRECRNLVRQEFGVTLHINDDALLEKLCAFGERSRERKLPLLVLPIKRLLLYGHASPEFVEMDLSAIPNPVRASI